MWRPSLAVPVAFVALLAGCGGGGNRAACSNHDGVLSNAAFVFVESPVSGDRVSSGFEVSGCSSTFEGTVGWSVADRNGRTLARGSAQGGAIESGPFSFTVDYSLSARQVGRLIVTGPRVTSEGFPPVANVIPLVLDT
jgi:Immunoglobulin-like domain of bacterial spore germination